MPPKKKPLPKLTINSLGKDGNQKLEVTPENFEEIREKMKTINPELARILANEDAENNNDQPRAKKKPNDKLVN